MARKEPQATPSEDNSAGSVSLVSDDRRSLANVIDLEFEIGKKPPNDSQSNMGAKHSTEPRPAKGRLEGRAIGSKSS